MQVILKTSPEHLFSYMNGETFNVTKFSDGIVYLKLNGHEVPFKLTDVEFVTAKNTVPELPEYPFMSITKEGYQIETQNFNKFIVTYSVINRLSLNKIEDQEIAFRMVRASLN